MSILIVFLLALWDLNSMKCEIFSSSKSGSKSLNGGLNDYPLTNDLISEKDRDYFRDFEPSFNFDKDLRDFPTRRSGPRIGLQGVTQRRSSLDNNFMRFGRDKLDKRQSEAIYGQDDLDSTGTREYPSGRSSVTRDSRGDNFMRFGRAQSLMRFGRANNLMRFGRAGGNSLMRFGRAAGNNLMRFGRANNGFIRFGRAGFMRFGRDPNAPTNYLANLLEDAEDSDDTKDMSKKAGNLMRFGRSEKNFMRFGKLDKNFMRFGKRTSSAEEESKPLDTEDDHLTDDGDIESYSNLLNNGRANDDVRFYMNLLKNGSYEAGDPDDVDEAVTPEEITAH